MDILDEDIDKRWKKYEDDKFKKEIKENKKKQKQTVAKKLYFATVCFWVILYCSYANIAGGYSYPPDLNQR